MEIKFKNQKAILDKFQTFYGIGPATAMKFYNQGFRTVDDLRSKANLTEAQLLGIQWHSDIIQRIDRREVDAISQSLQKTFEPYKIIWTIAGSYRREEKTSGDIDIIIESQPDLDMSTVISLLRSVLVADLAVGETKYMGIIKIPELSAVGHRIDIRLIEKRYYSFALLYFTGSKKFNIICRQRATQLGLTLNEYGLYNSDKTRIPASSEKDIFDFLGIEYLAPFKRTNDVIDINFKQPIFVKRISFKNTNTTTLSP
jgi:DNA polymerase lambda